MPPGAGMPRLTSASGTRHPPKVIGAGCLTIAFLTSAQSAVQLLQPASRAEPDRRGTRSMARPVDRRACLDKHIPPAV